jgi:hypothetical protein
VSDGDLRWFKTGITGEKRPVARGLLLLLLLLLMIIITIIIIIIIIITSNIPNKSHGILKLLNLRSTLYISKQKAVLKSCSTGRKFLAESLLSDTATLLRTS